MTQPTPHPTPRPAPRRVLEDESGRRLRRLRFVGRVVALLAFAWLALVILGGLGVGPARHVPFGSSFRLTESPPPVQTLPKPTPPTPADLAPALPAPPGTAASTTPSVVQKTATATRRKVTVPAVRATHGHSASAPGQLAKKTTTTTTATTHGKSTLAPGQAKHTTTTTAATTTTHGNSTTAPGHVKPAVTTTTVHGNGKQKR